MKYQPFHDLPASQYEALKASITEHGVLKAIDVDEDGNVLDGHQRRRVCAELHIDCPEQVVADLLSDEAREAYAITVNLHRRHLSGTERAQAIGRLKTKTGWSNVRVAEALGVDEKQVRRDLAKSEVRTLSEPEADTSGSRESEASGSDAAAPDDDASGTAAPSPSPEPNPAPRVTGKDGKSYPAARGTDRSKDAVTEREEKVRALAARGYLAQQIADELGIGRKGVTGIAKRIGVELTADAVVANTRRIDSNRVVDQTIANSGLEASLASLIVYGALDRSRLEGWVSSLSDVIRSLTTLNTNLKKELSRDQQ